MCRWCASTSAAKTYPEWTPQLVSVRRTLGRRCGFASGSGTESPSNAEVGFFIDPCCGSQESSHRRPLPTCQRSPVPEPCFYPGTKYQWEIGLKLAEPHLDQICRSRELFPGSGSKIPPPDEARLYYGGSKPSLFSVIEVGLSELFLQDLRLL